MTVKTTLLNLPFRPFCVILERLSGWPIAVRAGIEAKSLLSPQKRFPPFAIPHKGLNSCAERSEEHTSELQSLMPISYAGLSFTTSFFFLLFLFFFLYFFFIFFFF